MHHALVRSLPPHRSRQEVPREVGSSQNWRQCTARMHLRHHAVVRADALHRRPSLPPTAPTPALEGSLTAQLPSCRCGPRIRYKYHTQRYGIHSSRYYKYGIPYSTFTVRDIHAREVLRYVKTLRATCTGRQQCARGAAGRGLRGLPMMR
eukprot:164571-Pleurochrysis_carterae.AAC.3